MGKDTLCEGCAEWGLAGVGGDNWRWKPVRLGIVQARHAPRQRRTRAVRELLTAGPATACPNAHSSVGQTTRVGICPELAPLPLARESFGYRQRFTERQTKNLRYVPCHAALCIFFDCLTFPSTQWQRQGMETVPEGDNAEGEGVAVQGSGDGDGGRGKRRRRKKEERNEKNLASPHTLVSPDCSMSMRSQGKQVFDLLQWWMDGVIREA